MISLIEGRRDNNLMLVLCNMSCLAFYFEQSDYTGTLWRSCVVEGGGPNPRPIIEQVDMNSFINKYLRKEQNYRLKAAGLPIPSDQPPKSEDEKKKKKKKKEKKGKKDKNEGEEKKPEPKKQPKYTSRGFHPVHGQRPRVLNLASPSIADPSPDEEHIAGPGLAVMMSIEHDYEKDDKYVGYFTTFQPNDRTILPPPSAHHTALESMDYGKMSVDFNENMFTEVRDPFGCGVEEIIATQTDTSGDWDSSHASLLMASFIYNAKGMSHRVDGHIFLGRVGSFYYSARKENPVLCQWTAVNMQLTDKVFAFSLGGMDENPTDFYNVRLGAWNKASEIGDGSDEDQGLFMLRVPQMVYLLNSKMEVLFRAGNEIEARILHRGLCRTALLCMSGLHIFHGATEYAHIPFTLNDDLDITNLEFLDEPLTLEDMKQNPTNNNNKRGGFVLSYTPHRGDRLPYTIMQFSEKGELRGVFPGGMRLKEIWLDQNVPGHLLYDTLLGQVGCLELLQ
eukprot:TRINITY_DN3904_c0_g1_i2.p1 TRINITY_DN3904_c0_g1~~TRINITY_DN3904_c0_g1_i2.p1  ORF type:complete len:573 (+),score=111.24 TRINITY_DN3904_c0_g1_i2:202-1719(+)